MRWVATWCCRARLFLRTFRSCCAGMGPPRKRPRPSTSLFLTREVKMDILARADRHAIDGGRPEPPLADRRDHLLVNVPVEGFEKAGCGHVPAFVNRDFHHHVAV